VLAYTQPRVRISPAPPLSVVIMTTTCFPGDELPRAKSLSPSKRTRSKDSKTAKFVKTSSQVHHPKSELLRVSVAAKELGLSISTVIRWCETGQLPAVPKAYGQKTTYLIHRLTLESFQQRVIEPEKSISTVKSVPVPIPQPRVDDHRKHLSGWVKAMERGLITGKPYSAATIEMYEYYATGFIQSHKVVNMGTLRLTLMGIPKDAYCKRFKVYKAIISFAKYLIAENALEASFLEEAKPLYPKRHKPPKRLTVDKTQLDKLLRACSTPFETALIHFLVGTGLRISEVVSLERKRVNLGKQTLEVYLGKGNKNRELGLSPIVVSHLQAYFAKTRSRWAFVDEEGNQLSRYALYHRLKRLSDRTGIPVTPHSLRRAFVTLNAHKGRPIPMLQIACGHSSIKTTMDYCQITQQEVVDAMKDWQ
jgi:integrase